MLAAGSRSWANPAASEETGKSVSPSAAMAPLIPSSTTDARLTPAIQAALPRDTESPAALVGAGLSVLHHAVSARQASSIRVLIRCVESE